MENKLRRMTLHALAAAIAWPLAHSLSGRLVGSSRSREVSDGVGEALIESGAHAVSVMAAPLLAKRLPS